MDIRRSSEVVGAVRRVLEAAPGETWTLHRIGREVGRDPEYLATLFKQQLGRTIREFLRELRFQEAVRRLVEGEKVEATALAVGYRSYSSFSRAFTRYYGYRPGQARQRLGMNPLTQRSST